MEGQVKLKMYVERGSPLNNGKIESTCISGRTSVRDKGEQRLMKLEKFVFSAKIDGSFNLGCQRPCIIHGRWLEGHVTMCILG